MYFLFFLIKRLLGTITMSMTELFEDSVRWDSMQRAPVRLGVERRLRKRQFQGTGSQGQNSSLQASPKADQDFSPCGQTTQDSATSCLCCSRDSSMLVNV